MPNIKISDLPPIGLPIDLNTSFLEVQTVEGGEDVSRKATVDQIAQAGGAPADATYVTLSLNGTLTAERTLAGEAGVVSITDNGAGLTVEIGIDALGIDTAKLAADAVDNTKLADMAQDTIKGRQTGSGTGDPEDLTAAQVVAIISSSLPASGYFLLTATDRVIGSNAGTSNSGDNVFLANALAGDNNIADNVIAIGPNALAAAAQLDFDGSIVIGQNAGALIADTRDPWIIIGQNAAANIPGAAFHDGNTIIGTDALTTSVQSNLQANTIIGHEAASTLNGTSGVCNSSVVIGYQAGSGGSADASIVSSVLIGRGAGDSMGTAGVSNSVCIGNNAGEDFAGAANNVVIGANAVTAAINMDNCVILGNSAFSLFSGTVSDQIILGSSGWQTTTAGNVNIVIGNSTGTNGAVTYDHCIIIGHRAGNDMPDDNDVFAIEQPQGTSSSLARPYLYGNMLNGNLALLNIASMSGGVESGTRSVPAWADAAPTAGQGVFSMFGAGTDLAATTDADFVHLWIRASDSAYMMRYPGGDDISLLHNGTDSILANSAGAMRLNGIGDVILSSNSVEGLRLAEDNSGVLQVPSAAVTVTAFAGGGQGSATALIHSYNVITVVATAGDSVRLPDVFSVNSLVYIKNDDPADAADIFPAVGDDLGAGVNTAVSLPAGESVTFIATAGSSTWTELIVAPGSAPITVATSLLATNPAGPAIVDEASTSTNPTLIPNQAELDTGIGWNSTDALAFILGGVREVVLSAGSMNSGTGNSWALPNEAASRTNPNLVPQQGDFSSGIGGAVPTGTVSEVALIARGVELIRGTSHTSVAALRQVIVSPGALLGAIATPSFAFGTGNTGLTELVDDQLSVVIGGFEGLRFTELNSGVVQAPDADLAITAFAGGGQGSAVPLTKSYNVATTVASFNDSVRLPDVFAINSIVTVKNNGAQRLGIFPASGDDLGEGVNTLISLATGSSYSFIATVADSTWTLLDTNISTALLGLNNNGPQIADILATLTVPNLLPNKTDVNTGVGWGGSDILPLIAGGVQAQQFRELAGGVVQAPSTSRTVTAFAGGGQGSATALIDSYNIITTVATTGDSVRLPDIYSVNAIVFIKNDGANACDVFPASGDDLGSGVNTAVSLAAGESISFLGTTSSSIWTPWIVDTNTVAAPLTVEEVTANVTQTQASGTVPTSRLVTVISVNAGDSVTLPSVFAVDETIELNMPDVDEDDATAAIFPALGDDLGEGVNTAFTMQPHTNVIFQATTANSTWARLARGSSSVFPLFADGGMVLDETSEEDNPTLCPRASQPTDGVGSGNPGEVGFVADGSRSVKYVKGGTGVLQVEPDRQKAVTAFATGGQTNAVELLETYNVVTVVATAGDSVKLPVTFAGNSIIWVSNDDSTDAMDLFPGLGDDLGQGLNTALSVTAGTTVCFIAAGALDWLQLI